MPTKFGNIVDPKRSVLMGFNTIEKSLDFVKTEKEIYNIISEKINRMMKNQFQIEEMKKEIEILLNERPTQDSKYYLGYNEDNEESEYAHYLTYNINNAKSKNGCDECEEKPLSLDEDPKQADMIDEKISLKLKYNELSRKYCMFIDKIKKMQLIKNNLNKNSNRKINLGFNELREFSF